MSFVRHLLSIRSKGCAGFRRCCFAVHRLPLHSLASYFAHGSGFDCASAWPRFGLEQHDCTFVEFIQFYSSCSFLGMESVVTLCEIIFNFFKVLYNVSNRIIGTPHYTTRSLHSYTLYSLHSHFIKFKYYDE